MGGASVGGVLWAEPLYEMIVSLGEFRPLLSVLRSLTKSRIRDLPVQRKVSTRPLLQSQSSLPEVCMEAAYWGVCSAQQKMPPLVGPGGRCHEYTVIVELVALPLITDIYNAPPGKTDVIIPTPHLQYCGVILPPPPPV